MVFPINVIIKLYKCSGAHIIKDVSIIFFSLSKFILKSNVMIETEKPSLQPLVSCLCVTKNKTHKLKRAIDCFLSQTYENKELVIVTEDNDLETSIFLKRYSQRYIKHIEVKSCPKLTLGELRNISIENSDGEYFCQWDDDDWYRCDRLSIQTDAAINNFHPISIMSNWLIYDEITKQAYCSPMRLWEGSILCKKDIINDKIKYPSLVKGEDSVFVEMLLMESKIYPIANPGIYVYTYNGSNTSSQEHFASILRGSKKMSNESSETITNILNGNYSFERAKELLDSKEILSEMEYFYDTKFFLRNKKNAQV